MRDQRCELIDDVTASDRPCDVRGKRTPGELVHHGEDLQWPGIDGRIELEVVAPDVAWELRGEPVGSGAGIAQAPLPALRFRDLQVLSAREAPRTAVTDLSSASAHQVGAVAVTAPGVILGKFVQLLPDGFLVKPWGRLVTLR